MFSLIVNPVAGGGKALEAVQRLRRRAEDFGVNFHMRKTAGIGDARAMARSLAGCNIEGVVAVGGDGTAQEIAAGIMDGGELSRDLAMGVIPVGSGNDFYRSLTGSNAPTSLDDAICAGLRALRDGRVRPIDVVGIDTLDEYGAEIREYCLNIASVGLDAEIVKRANGIKRWLGGGAYLVSTAVTSVLFGGMRVKIQADGGEAENRRLMLTAVCNGMFYGGGFNIAPSADMGDGLLTVCTVEKMNRVRVLALFPRVLNGSHVDMRDVGFKNAETVRLALDGRTLLNIDGNLRYIKDTATFSALKGALKVFA